MHLARLLFTTPPTAHRVQHCLALQWKLFTDWADLFVAWHQQGLYHRIYRGKRAWVLAAARGEMKKPVDIPEGSRSALCNSDFDVCRVFANQHPELARIHQAKTQSPTHSFRASLDELGRMDFPPRYAALLQIGRMIALGTHCKYTTSAVVYATPRYIMETATSWPNEWIPFVLLASPWMYMRCSAQHTSHELERWLL